MQKCFTKNRGLTAPMRFVPAALLMLWCGLASAQDSPLSNAVIQAWWNKHSRENLTVDGDGTPVRLRGGELAWLYSATFPRGRNDMFHTLMVRPTLQEAREVEDPLRQRFEVHDLDKNGVSEVVATTLGSGQGSTEGVQAIVQFDGWMPIVLHQKSFNDNLGNCGPQHRGGYGPCKVIEVQWKFADINGDGKADLMETISTKSGMDPSKLKNRRVTYRYLFNGFSFTRASNR